MYDLEAVKRRIEKEGLDSVIKDLSSSNLSGEIFDGLESSNIFVGGYLNLSLLYSLA